MALKKTVVTIHGFNADDAYHRVEGLRIEDKTKIVFNVRSAKDKDSIAFADQSFECQYDIDGKNPLAQAYAFLKSTDAFNDATDC